MEILLRDNKFYLKIYDFADMLSNGNTNTLGENVLNILSPPVFLICNFENYQQCEQFGKLSHL